MLLHAKSAKEQSDQKIRKMLFCCSRKIALDNSSADGMFGYVHATPSLVMMLSS